MISANNANGAATCTNLNYIYKEFETKLLYRKENSTEQRQVKCT